MKDERRALIGPMLVLIAILGGLLVLAWEFRPDPARALMHVSATQAVKRTHVVHASTKTAQQPFKLARYVPHLHARPIKHPL